MGTPAAVRIKCKDNSRAVKSLIFELDPGSTAVCDRGPVHFLSLCFLFCASRITGVAIFPGLVVLWVLKHTAQYLFVFVPVPLPARDPVRL